MGATTLPCSGWERRRPLSPCRDQLSDLRGSIGTPRLRSHYYRTVSALWGGSTEEWGRVLPESVGQDLKWRHRDLVDIDPAIQGLRQWLRIHVLAPGELAMPSRSVDLLWHEFILNTKAYDQFCAKAYAHKLDHKPAKSMTTDQLVRLRSEGLGWTFALACRDENLSLAHPSKVPLLFGVDSEIGIPDGRPWILSCGQPTCSSVNGKGCIQHAVLPHLPRKLPPQGRRDASGRFVLIPSDVPVIPPMGPDWGSFDISCGG
jgi:hypothetical protein